MCTCKYCGKEYSSNTALAGHISHCKLNSTKKRTSESYKVFSKKGLDTYLSNLEKTKLEDSYRFEIKEFILTCPKCKNNFSIFTTQRNFDKGNHKVYCSRSCANSHILTDEIKKKISYSIQFSEKFKEANKQLSESFLKKRQEKQHICKYCGKIFTLNDIRDIDGIKYCSCECKHKYLSEHYGGYRKGSGRGKNGWYKGIYCDSTWELAFVIYHLDHNLHIERCNTPREYEFNGEKHLYYPDFVTDEGIFEIKGYITEQWKAKQEQNPDIKVLYKKDIQQYIDYVKNTYTNDIQSLYEYHSKNEINKNDLLE